MSRYRVTFVALLALVLGGCTVYVRPDTTPPVRPVPVSVEAIRTFEPTRGAGAVYDLGSTISFRLLTTQDGYVTLTSFGAGGVVRVFERNVFVRANTPVELPGDVRRVAYEVSPPRGERTVRASFSPEPFPDELPEGALDEAETTFFVR
ncbi:DUF4384 domain-containing protein [Truepera radiovictrix]|uniref:DUF4384 domain-containing protein n=1 Tax=Truepera radiovictrix (strain DSM 17093 / CIP 108686 / LMG 22925 / RQ-24) TaxID=649638 RepID=D7CXR8_TRURR|nr:DUF4384 domain-containing protein [Truepera radiovictrix]ADI14670.1 conserved hypothetical protein [Truepera radiovictrix DSM 17093]WMT56780.1 DUF4384 domain-containing protein [Truepera radiovictrix]